MSLVSFLFFSKLMSLTCLYQHLYMAKVESVQILVVQLSPNPKLKLEGNSFGPCRTLNYHFTTHHQHRLFYQFQKILAVERQYIILALAQKSIAMKKHIPPPLNKQQHKPFTWFQSISSRTL